MYRAVFVDRDGTINRDVPYCSRPDDFELLPTVARGIRLLNERGFRVVVVTNQSGIARGYFTQGMLALIHQKMQGDLAKDRAFIDAIYYCPHHPDEGCQCRKPNTGLFHKAASELNIDLSHSYVIGDRHSDVVAARKVGCKAVLVPSEPEMLQGNPEPENQADFVCSSFYLGAAWIVAQTDGPNQSVELWGKDGDKASDNHAQLLSTGWRNSNSLKRNL